MYLIFKILHKFPPAPMGVLAPGSAHAKPSAQPPIWEGGQKKLKIFRSIFSPFQAILSNSGRKVTQGEEEKNCR